MAICSCELNLVAEKKEFTPVVEETPQSSVPVRGRGASWSPANRFEKLHVDLTDADLVDVDPAGEERPRRPTQYFRDGTKSIITRNTSPEGDSELFRELAACNAAAVNIPVTSLDTSLQRILEPRTTSPHGRLDAISQLRAANVPVGVMVAPIIPGLTDHEVPKILDACAKAGAQFAGYTIIRLPWAVAPLFEHWLAEHFPDRKEKVLGRIRHLRGNRLNNSQWHTRMTGEGIFAEQIASLFKVGCRRAGIGARPALSCKSFRQSTTQLRLFA